MTLPSCPACARAFTYELGAGLVCPECALEWSPEIVADDEVVRDAVGNVLADGDTVTVITSLKVKGSTTGSRRAPRSATSGS